MEPYRSITLMPEIRTSDFKVFLAETEAGSVDLVLTDPPYAISRPTGFAKVKTGVERFAVSMDFGEWDQNEIDIKSLAQHSYRVLRQGGTAIIWYDVWKLTHVETAMREAGFKMLRLIIWQKKNPVPLNQSSTYLSNSREIAVCGVKGGKPCFHGKYHNGIYEYPIPRHNGQRIHPTQKSLELFSELIEMHSNPGDTVIDPFLGGGTTAVAALSKGRNFRGGDIASEYVQKSISRLQDIYPELRLADESRTRDA